MSHTDRSLKVFLSHAHADREPVRALYKRLIKDGVDAWLDKEKLLPGQDWELEIRKAVRESDVVVVCLSAQFNQAGFRQKEVRLALDTAMEQPEGEIFIIPARLEECDNLESLRKWHQVDLFEEDGYEKLIRALQVRAGKIDAALQVKQKGTSGQIAKEKNKKIPPANLDSVNSPQKNKSTWKTNTAITVALIGAVATIIAALISSPLLVNAFEKHNAELTSIASPVETLQPTFLKPVTETFQQPAEDTWSQIISARTPTLNEIREDMLSIWDANNLSLGDMLSPEMRSFSGVAKSTNEYLWPIFWCAIDRSTLDIDVKNITTAFTVNDERVPDEYIFDYYYDTDNGWKCNYRATVIGSFPKNKPVNLQVARTFKTEIFDGQITYPAGDYIYKLVISVK